MSDTKYTSGDWKVDVWDYSKADPPRKELVICSDKNRLAVIECDFDSDNPYQIPEAEARANANLMAASSKLLAACKKVLDYHDKQGKWDDTLDIDVRDELEEAIKLAKIIT